VSRAAPAPSSSPGLSATPRQHSSIQQTDHLPDFPDGHYPRLTRTEPANRHVIGGLGRRIAALSAPLAASSPCGRWARCRRAACIGGPGAV